MRQNLYYKNIISDSVEDKGKRVILMHVSNFSLLNNFLSVIFGNLEVAENSAQNSRIKSTVSWRKGELNDAEKSSVEDMI